MADSNSTKVVLHFKLYQSSLGKKYLEDFITTFFSFILAFVQNKDFKKFIPVDSKSCSTKYVF